MPPSFGSGAVARSHPAQRRYFEVLQVRSCDVKIGDVIQLPDSDPEWHRVTDVDDNGQLHIKLGDVTWSPKRITLVPIQVEVYR